MLWSSQVVHAFIFSYTEQNKIDCQNIGGKIEQAV